MQLDVGGTTKTVAMKTPQHFTSAMKSPLLKPRVFSVTDARDHAELLKTLSATTRPYAVCVLSVTNGQRVE
ncbi:MAG: hypothetical protein JW395_3754 [Nitrospira sp.]|nr:hypothetical protein [Nitrospira sp.]